MVYYKHNKHSKLSKKNDPSELLNSKKTKKSLALLFKNNKASGGYKKMKGGNVGNGNGNSNGNNRQNQSIYENQYLKNIENIEHLQDGGMKKSRALAHILIKTYKNFNRLKYKYFPKMIMIKDKLIDPEEKNGISKLQRMVKHIYDLENRLHYINNPNASQSDLLSYATTEEDLKLIGLWYNKRYFKYKLKRRIELKGSTITEKIMSLQDIIRKQLMKEIEFKSYDEKCRSLKFWKGKEFGKRFQVDNLICNMNKFRYLESKFNKYYKKFQTQYMNFISNMDSKCSDIEAYKAKHSNYSNQYKVDAVIEVPDRFDFTLCKNFEDINSKIAKHTESLRQKTLDEQTALKALNETRPDTGPEKYNKDLGKYIKKAKKSNKYSKQIEKINTKIKILDEVSADVKTGFNSLYTNLEVSMKEFNKLFETCELVGLHRYANNFPKNKKLKLENQIKELSQNQTFITSFEKTIKPYQKPADFYLTKILEENDKEYESELIPKLLIRENFSLTDEVKKLDKDLDTRTGLAVSWVPFGPRSKTGESTTDTYPMNVVNIDWDLKNSYFIEYKLAVCIKEIVDQIDEDPTIINFVGGHDTAVIETAYNTAVTEINKVGRKEPTTSHGVQTGKAGVTLDNGITFVVIDNKAGSPFSQNDLDLIKLAILYIYSHKYIVHKTNEYIKLDTNGEPTAADKQDLINKKANLDRALEIEFNKNPKNIFNLVLNQDIKTISTCLDDNVNIICLQNLDLKYIKKINYKNAINVNNAASTTAQGIIPYKDTFTPVAKCGCGKKNATFGYDKYNVIFVNDRVFYNSNEYEGDKIKDQTEHFTLPYVTKKISDENINSFAAINIISPFSVKKGSDKLGKKYNSKMSTDDDSLKEKLGKFDLEKLIIKDDNLNNLKNNETEFKNEIQMYYKSIDNIKTLSDAQIKAYKLVVQLFEDYAYAAKYNRIYKDMNEIKYADGNIEFYTALDDALTNAVNAAQGVADAADKASTVAAATQDTVKNATILASAIAEAAGAAATLVNAEVTREVGVLRATSATVVAAAKRAADRATLLANAAVIAITVTQGQVAGDKVVQAAAENAAVAAAKKVADAVDYVVTFNPTISLADLQAIAKFVSLPILAIAEAVANVKAAAVGADAKIAAAAAKTAAEKTTILALGGGAIADIPTFLTPAVIQIQPRQPITAPSPTTPIPNPPLDPHLIQPDPTNNFNINIENYSLINTLYTIQENLKDKKNRYTNIDETLFNNTQEASNYFKNNIERDLMNHITNIINNKKNKNKIEIFIENEKCINDVLTKYDFIKKRLDENITEYRNFTNINTLVDTSIESLLNKIKDDNSIYANDLTTKMNDIRADQSYKDNSKVIQNFTKSAEYKDNFKSIFNEYEQYKYKLANKMTIFTDVVNVTKNIYNYMKHYNIIFCKKNLYINIFIENDDYDFFFDDNTITPIRLDHAQYWKDIMKMIILSYVNLYDENISNNDVKEFYKKYIKPYENEDANQYLFYKYFKDKTIINNFCKYILELHKNYINIIQPIVPTNMLNMLNIINTEFSKLQNAPDLTTYDTPAAGKAIFNPHLPQLQKIYENAQLNIRSKNLSSPIIQNAITEFEKYKTVINNKITSANTAAIVRDYDYSTYFDIIAENAMAAIEPTDANLTVADLAVDEIFNILNTEKKIITAGAPGAIGVGIVPATTSTAAKAKLRKYYNYNNMEDAVAFATSNEIIQILSNHFAPRSYFMIINSAILIASLIIENMIVDISVTHIENIAKTVISTIFKDVISPVAINSIIANIKRGLGLSNTAGGGQTVSEERNPNTGALTALTLIGGLINAQIGAGNPVAVAKIAGPPPATLRTVKAAVDAGIPNIIPDINTITNTEIRANAEIESLYNLDVYDGAVNSQSLRAKATALGGGGGAIDILPNIPLVAPDPRFETHRAQQTQQYEKKFIKLLENTGDVCKLLAKHIFKKQAIINQDTAVTIVSANLQDDSKSAILIDIVKAYSKFIQTITYLDNMIYYEPKGEPDVSKTIEYIDNSSNKTTIINLEEQMNQKYYTMKSTGNPTNADFVKEINKHLQYLNNIQSKLLKIKTTYASKFSEINAMVIPLSGGALKKFNNYNNVHMDMNMDTYMDTDMDTDMDTNSNMYRMKGGVDKTQKSYTEKGITIVSTALIGSKKDDIKNYKEIIGYTKKMHIIKSITDTPKEETVNGLRNVQLITLYNELLKHTGNNPDFICGNLGGLILDDPLDLNLRRMFLDEFNDFTKKTPAEPITEDIFRDYYVLIDKSNKHNFKLSKKIADKYYDLSSKTSDTLPKIIKENLRNESIFSSYTNYIIIPGLLKNTEETFTNLASNNYVNTYTDTVLHKEIKSIFHTIIQSKSLYRLTKKIQKPLIPVPPLSLSPTPLFEKSTIIETYKLIELIMRHFSIGRQAYLQREYGCFSINDMRSGSVFADKEKNMYNVRNYEDKDKFYTLNYPSFIEVLINQKTDNFNSSTPKRTNAFYNENQYSVVSPFITNNQNILPIFTQYGTSLNYNVMDVASRLLLIPSKDISQLVGFDLKNEKYFKQKDYVQLAKTFALEFYKKASNNLEARLKEILTPEIYMSTDMTNKNQNLKPQNIVDLLLQKEIIKGVSTLVNIEFKNKTMIFKFYEFIMIMMKLKYFEYVIGDLSKLDTDAPILGGGYIERKLINYNNRLSQKNTHTTNSTHTAHNLHSTNKKQRTHKKHKKTKINKKNTQNKKNTKNVMKI